MINDNNNKESTTLIEIASIYIISFTMINRVNLSQLLFISSFNVEMRR